MLKKVWIYYDGNYFSHVSEYYYRWHKTRSRISIEGLHGLVRAMVSEFEGHDLDFTRVVDVKYFRGKVQARDMENRDDAYFERSFEDLLMRLGVSMHFSPVKTDLGTGERREKGVDVSLALEAYSSAYEGKYDVLVLVAGDGDYVPLVRKLNGLWVRVMVLGWNFKHPTGRGENETAVSRDLMREVIYPVDMALLIDQEKQSSGKPVSEAVKTAAAAIFLNPRSAASAPATDWRKEGTVVFLKENYGFIAYGKNPDDKEDTQAFVHESELMGIEIADLKKGDRVTFKEDGERLGRMKAVEVRKK